MCRLVGYIGQPIPLERLLYQPEHSLVHQSYQPKEMTSGVVNADGFGIGWYGSAETGRPSALDTAGQSSCYSLEVAPFSYRSVLPIWNDINLPDLSRYVTSELILASIRSATPGLAIGLSNCPPFRYHRTLMVHNGAVDNFRQTLLTPLQQRLSPQFARVIEGATDSEYLFALILDEWENGAGTLEQALSKAVLTLLSLGDEYGVAVSANVILSQGERLVACRAGTTSPQPSLYWLQEDTYITGGVAIASEPLWSGRWQPFPEHTLLTVEKDLSANLQSL